MVSRTICTFLLTALVYSNNSFSLELGKPPLLDAEDHAVPTASSLTAATNSTSARVHQNREFMKPSSSPGEEIVITSKESKMGVMAKSRIDLNTDSLRAGSVVQGLMHSTSQPLAGVGSATIELPGGDTVSLVTKRLSVHTEGVETYSGFVAEFPKSSWFVISIEGEQVFGYISIEFMTYHIEYDSADGSHVVSEIDQKQMMHDAPDPVRSKKNSKRKIKDLAIAPQSITSPDNANVRILILYADNITNISTLASNMISSMNDSLFDDGFDPDFHFSLAGTRELNSDLDGECKDDIINDMITAVFPFAGIVNWTNTNDADVVVAIAEADPTGCSYNGVGGQATILDSTDPYAIIFEEYVLGDLTATHEVGHVMGGGHPEWSDYNLTVDHGTVVYARGFTEEDGDWQTLMGGYGQNDCTFVIEDGASQDCVRINRWSDPDKTHLGETIGSTSSPEADMVRVLEENMPDVAEWESYPDSAPATPSNFSVDHTSCYGANDASWDSTTDAEFYHLFEDTSASFNSPELIYHGTSTSVGVMVPSSPTHYFKVRACNGSGCGTISSSDTGYYFPGCS